MIIKKILDTTKEPICNEINTFPVKLKVRSEGSPMSRFKGIIFEPKRTVSKRINDARIANGRYTIEIIDQEIPFVTFVTLSPIKIQQIRFRTKYVTFIARAMGWRSFLPFLLFASRQF